MVCRDRDVESIGIDNISSGRVIFDEAKRMKRHLNLKKILR